MPTAGEYKHEPSGIPCHCYVRRRLHHSTCRKSCLRKQSDSSAQSYGDSKSKKVTFNPILRVRSYDNLKDPELDSNPLPNAIKEPVKRIESHQHDVGSNTSALCNKLTSLLDPNQPCKASREHETFGRAACNHNTRRDQNNNIVDRADSKMNSNKFCPICELKRHKSPVRGYHYQKTRDRTPSPCGFHQPYQTANKTIKPLELQKNTNCSRITPSLPAKSKYHVPRRLFRRDSLADSSSETSSQKDSSAGYENMNTLTSLASTATDLDCSSVYINGENDNKNSRPVSIFIKGDQEEDKLDEYIYEIPLNNRNDQGEYDYVTIGKTQKAQSDSPIDQSTRSFTRLIKHKTETDLTSKGVEDYTIRPKHPVPRSAPDLQTMTSPYDIQFVDEPSPSRYGAGGEQVELFAASSTMDKSQMSTINKLSKNRSPFIDILKMTPIAFFWTGCAFLIAMVYIFLFPCPYEHN